MLIHTQSEMDSVRKYGPFILVQSCWLQPEVMKLKEDYNEHFQKIYFKLFLSHSNMLLKILKDNKGNEIRQNNTTYSSWNSPAAIMFKTAGLLSHGQPSHWWTQVRKLKTTLCQPLCGAWHTFYQNLPA